MAGYYNPRYPAQQPYSSFNGLKDRASFPYSVHNMLRHECGMSGMEKFLEPSTLEVLHKVLSAWDSEGNRRRVSRLLDNYRIEKTHVLHAIKVWHDAVRAHQAYGKTHPTRNTREEEDMSNVKHVNADRNEMVALLQHAKGAQFVLVRQCWSRLTDDDETSSSKGDLLTYKAVGLDLKVGDKVIVQYRDRFGIGIIDKLLPEAPTSDEYDYRIQLKHVVQKIDEQRSAQLEALDKQMLQKITASEAQDRLTRLTQQLGIDMDSISLSLPPIDG